MTTNISWISLKMKFFCKSKRGLYIANRNNKNSSIKAYYYNNYCKMLSKVIKAVRRLNYEKQIRNLNNKMKTTWRIICLEAGRIVQNNSTYKITDVNLNTMNNRLKLGGGYFLRHRERF